MEDMDIDDYSRVC